MAFPEQLQTERDFFDIFKSISAGYAELSSIEREVEVLDAFSHNPQAHFLGLTKDSTLADFAHTFNGKLQEKHDLRHEILRLETMARGLLLGQIVEIVHLPVSDGKRIWQRHTGYITKAMGNITDARFKDTGYLPYEEPEMGVITVQEIKRRPRVFDVQPMRNGFAEVSVHLIGPSQY